jgi:hypothetical protein
MAQQPRRQASSYLAPWEPEISLLGRVLKLQAKRVRLLEVKAA